MPDESFLMVAQITWEDDIIWDVSEEIRKKVRIYYYFNVSYNSTNMFPTSCCISEKSANFKCEITFQVMENSNCKNNAAGWLPSHMNRTAQTLSQHVKGSITPLGNSMRLNPSQMNSSAKIINKYSL